ncbi:MAG TPA: c-type cytochrome, partial [Hyphomonadaceae bacterium]|nr:c-type cytochrome [Hyphomonadaceae bacterium]
MKKTLLVTALGCASMLVLASCQTPAPAEPAKPSAPVVAQAPATVQPPQRPTPAPQPVSASDASGEALYQGNCAQCHDHTDQTRAPARDALKAMSFQFVNYTLTSGKMKDMGAKLTPEQRGTLVGYLTGRGGQANDDWAKAAMCAPDKRAVDLSGQVVSSHFGFDRNNTRTLSAKQAGLTKTQLSDMDVAWSIGFPDVAEMRSTGAIIGSTMFFPVAGTGQMYAIDLAGPKPCFKWVYTAPGGASLRSSV